MSAVTGILRIFLCVSVLVVLLLLLRGAGGISCSRGACAVRCAVARGEPGAHHRCVRLKWRHVIGAQRSATRGRVSHLRSVIEARAASMDWHLEPGRVSLHSVVTSHSGT